MQNTYFWSPLLHEQSFGNSPQRCLCVCSSRLSRSALPAPDPLLTPRPGWWVLLGLGGIWRWPLPPPSPAGRVMDGGCCVPTIAMRYLIKMRIRASCNCFFWALHRFSKRTATRGDQPAWQRLVWGTTLLGRAGSGFGVVIANYPMAMDCIPGPAGLEGCSKVPSPVFNTNKL